MTPEELCQMIMDNIMRSAELITIKTEEDDGIEKRIFLEADKTIAKFESVYEFFKAVESYNAYQDGARYEKYKKQNRMPSSAIIAKFVGFVETDLLYECMKEALDKVGPGRSSEDLVERFYRDNHNYKRNEERKRERRLRRKLETLDRILEMEGWD